MQDKLRTIKVFLPPIVLMMVIFALSSMPGHTTGGHLNLLLYVEPQWQNLLHIPLFALLQILWLQAFTRIGRHGVPVMLVCLAISLIYSVVDELHQLYVPGRYASLSDMGLNALGVFLGSILFSCIMNKNLNTAT